MSEIKRKLVKISAACMAALLVGISTAGCAQGKLKKESEEKEITEIPVVFLVDPSTGLSSNQDFVNEFNELYKDEYFVNVEWLTESASGYREKLKQWNILDEMPAVITDAGFDYDLYRVLVENDRLVDLRPYMEQSGEWEKNRNNRMLRECMEPDGAIYLSPLESAVQSYAGIIYNTDLLAEAGWDTFPETWEEFWRCMEDLKRKGITPLSLHGSGSYWVPMLIATSYMYGRDEGRDFLEENFPESYRNPVMEDMLDMFRTLYKYTFEDGVEIDYQEAADRFLRGEAAVFANGYWMIEEMSEELKEKMSFAPFPGKILMNSPRMSAWAVTAGYDEDVIQGAARLLEYRILCDRKNTEELLAGEQEKNVKRTYIQAVEQVESVMPNYQMKWEQQIQNEFFSRYLPDFLDGTMNAETFLERMDETLKEIQNSK